MAFLHRFLKNSTSKFIKMPSDYLKPLSSIHNHGLTILQGPTALSPCLNLQPNPPPELNQEEQQIILDLLRKSYRPWHLDSPQFQQASEATDILLQTNGLPKLLEECGSQKLLEGSHGKAELREQSHWKRLGDPESDEVGLGEGLKIWADSVKKKRRKKMNKHKYKKLRKRLRRKT
eukprot:Gb_11076 [translate_table: standard]